MKSLIELHDGTVALTSAPGEGTEVICTVPRHPRKMETEEAGDDTE